MVIIKDYPLLFGFSLGLLLSLLFFSFISSFRNKKNQATLSILEDVIAVMPGHVYWVDKDSVYLGCNDNQAKSAGLNSRQEIKGKRNKDLPWNFNTNKLPKELDQINKKVISTGQTIMLEEPATLSDGTQASYLSIKSPLKN